MEDRGTASIELIFTTVFFIFILTGIVSVVTDRLDVVYHTQEMLEARMLIETVASSINNVYTAGNGQTEEFTLPPMVGNSTYTLRVNSSGVYIEFSGMMGKADIFSPIIINGLSNNSHTIELVPGRSYLIKNDKINNKSIISILSK